MQHLYRLKLSLVFLLQLAAVAAFAQVAPAAKPAAQNVKLLFEKVYVHTDRDYYSAGDNIWFKAYLVDAQTNLLNASSSNLHVELISPDEHVFATEVAFLNNGTAKGDFHLSDSIPEGNYRLRAYTNWMLNFGDNFIFEKSITIYNTPQNSKPIPATAIIKTETTPSATMRPGTSVIHFFPEGGSLVQGVAGVVSFKTEAPDGRGVSTKGAVFSSTGDTVAHFESTPQGLGLFVLVPDSGKTYSVKGVFNNKEPFTAAIPAALAKGYVLHVSETDSAHLRITVSTNQATMRDNPEKTVTLMARHTGTRFINGPLKFIFLQINAVVSKKQFPAGISSITIYDNALRPQAERLVYIADSTAKNAMTVKIDKQSEAGNQKVTVSINTSALGRPVKANLSLSAVNAKMVPVDAENITSYLELQSEIKGTIENPQMYFDIANEGRFKQLDLLLMTQGWRDFVWRRLADDGIHITHATENGFGLSGRLREKFADKPIAKTNVTMTVKGEVVSQQYMTKTDSAGKYKFRDIPIVGGKEVVLASFDDKQRKVGWIQMDSMDKSLPPVNQLPKDGIPEVAKIAFEKAAADGARLHPKLSDTVKLKEIKIRDNGFQRLFDQTTTKFGYPDLKYPISQKYYFYNSLSDFLIHEVPGARINAADSVVFKGVAFNAETNHQSSVDILPRFIANGREDADDLNNGTYLNLSMDVINSVLVRHVLGQAGAVANSSGNYRTAPPGDVYIIFLDLKPNAFDKVQFNQLTTQINGYYQARTFYRPAYTPAANQPDLSTIIHWEPNIYTDAQGNATVSFYGTSPSANLRIVVEGITDKGVPVTGGSEERIKN